MILLAAGRGERFGEGRSKVLAPLAGRPLVLHSLLRFQSHPEVHEIVLVCPPGEDLPWRQFMLRDVDAPKLRATVPGGEERQDSVRAGLEAVSAGADLLLIHDAARPLVPARMITEVLQAARETGAALPLLESPDTVKQKAGARVGGTIPRQELGLAQTPQAFQASLYREALAAAERDRVVATDDVALVERLDRPVAWVPGARECLKVTTQADLDWLEWWLARGEPND
ncbi:MAG: 2-C-methyl-D-erythritol 4-phosphate cytidylyltransferase [Candidatus Eisenbacteria bacterium]|nr:2-C-methyl-D-erythritol 4-phosphate cytidylyltransferase [Candidatus Eisenbacteria bacterium]